MKMRKIIRTYSELITLPTFEERFAYLQLNGKVGQDTFGFDRYLNQMFYKSKEWKKVRNHIIVRDYGCDLGIEGREIRGNILIHHINPIEKDDITNSTIYLLDPEFLICTSKNTHDAIHYGNEELLIKDPIGRRKNDTCPWKKT